MPKIIKNLVSVSKLTQDNNIYFEFHHRYCLIKDKGLGRVLLKGMLKEGLYHLEEFNAKEVGLSGEEKKAVNINKEHPSAFVLSNISVNSAISKSVWHRQLGQPSSRVFELIAPSCNLSFKRNEITNSINHVKWVKPVLFCLIYLNLVRQNLLI